MTSKINIRSIVIGLIIGLATVFVFGAASVRNEGRYQLSMATNDSYVIYGRIHTGTGKIETWKCLIRENRLVPLEIEDMKVFLVPDSNQ